MLRTVTCVERYHWYHGNIASICVFALFYVFAIELFTRLYGNFFIPYKDGIKIFLKRQAKGLPKTKVGKKLTDYKSRFMTGEVLK